MARVVDEVKAGTAVGVGHVSDDDEIFGCTPYQNSEDSEPVGLDNPLPPVSSDPPSIEGAQTPKASEGPTDTPRRTSQQNRLRMRMAPGADSPLEICAS